MANYVSPFEYLAPWLQPPTSQIEKGVAQGTQIARLRSEMPYMAAHAKLAEEQAAEKRATMDAYNQLMGGGKLLPGATENQGVTPAQALMYERAGLKDAWRFLTPERKFEEKTGQLVDIPRAGGPATVSTVPKYEVPRTFHANVPMGPNIEGPAWTTATGGFEPLTQPGPVQPLEPSPQSDSFPISQELIDFAQTLPPPQVPLVRNIRETPGEAAAKTTAQKQAEEDVRQTNEPAQIERERKLGAVKREPTPEAATRAGEIEKSRKEAEKPYSIDLENLRQKNRLESIKTAAQYNMKMVEHEDEEGKITRTYEPVTEIKGKRAPTPSGAEDKINNKIDSAWIKYQFAKTKTGDAKKTFQEQIYTQLGISAPVGVEFKNKEEFSAFIKEGKIPEGGGISIPSTVKTTSQAVAYVVKNYGKRYQEASDWVKGNPQGLKDDMGILQGGPTSGVIPPPKNVEPRKPGESISDYMKRTGAK